MKINYSSAPRSRRPPGSAKTRAASPTTWTLIKAQLAKLPTRKEQALKPLYVMFGSAAIILWIELFHRACL